MFLESAFDYSHPVYRDARRLAIKRSEGWCQFCGINRATQGHHWRGYKAGNYKPENETTSDDLIGLCDDCHTIATAIRKGYKEAKALGYEDGYKTSYTVKTTLMKAIKPILFFREGCDT